MDTELDFLKDLEKVLEQLDTPMEFITTEEVERKFPKYGKAICKYLYDKDVVFKSNYQLKGKRDGQIKLLHLDIIKKIKKEENSIEDRKRQRVSYWCNILISVFTGLGLLSSVIFGLLSRCSGK